MLETTWKTISIYKLKWIIWNYTKKFKAALFYSSINTSDCIDIYTDNYMQLIHRRWFKHNLRYKGFYIFKQTSSSLQRARPRFVFVYSLL